MFVNIIMVFILKALSRSNLLRKRAARKHAIHPK